jgi:chromosome segregation ATPase
MESRNSRLTSEIKTLKVEVEGKLEEVVGKIPSFGSQLDSLSSDSMKIDREMDSKLAQLDLELSTTRRDIESLKLAKTKAASEMTEVTSSKISQLEEKLSNLNEEYKTLMKIIQGCQSKYSTIEEQV